MKNQTRLFLMKILALTSIFLILYPVIEFARYKLFNTQSAFPWFLVLVFLLYGGYTALLFFPRLNSKRIRFFSFIIPLVSITLIYFNNNLTKILFELLAALVCWYVGVHNINKPYEQIFNTRRFVIGMIVLFTLFIIKGLANQQNQVLIILPIFIMIYFIVKNQSVLDMHIFKNYKQTDGFEGFRIHNLKKLILISLILICCLFLIWIPLSKINFPNIGPLWNNHISNPPPRNPTKVVGAEIIKKYLPYNKPNSYTLIAVIIIASAVVIYLIFLLIKYRKAIVKFFTKSSTRIIKEYEDYVLEEEMLDKKEKNKRAEDKHIFVPTLKKRHFAVLKRISDPIEKIRYLYGLMLDIIINRKINISKSDTSMEISEKSLRLKELEGICDNITRQYNLARYGGKVPSEDNILNLENQIQKVLDKG